MSGYIICFSKCEPCQFGQHDETPHPWVGGEDFDHMVATAQIPDTMTDAELLEAYPCNCRCQGRASSAVGR